MDTADQVEPSQCSASGTGACLAANCWAPTVQQSDGPTQVTPHSRDAVVPGGEVSGPAAHVDPFHRSTIACGCELLPRSENDPPTAQQLHVLVQAVSIRRSLLVDPVLGLGTMFHPEAAPALAVGTAVVMMRRPMATAPRQSMIFRPNPLRSILCISMYRHIP